MGVVEVMAFGGEVAVLSEDAALCGEGGTEVTAELLKPPIPPKEPIEPMDMPCGRGLPPGAGPNAHGNDFGASGLDTYRYRSHGNTSKE